MFQWSEWFDFRIRCSSLEVYVLLKNSLLFTMVLEFHSGYSCVLLSRIGLVMGAVDRPMKSFVSHEG